MIKVPSKKFANSSFAILEINGMFLLQKRDMKNKIWYPAMLGLFGGKIEKNENENQALRREILEELFRLPNLKEFKTAIGLAPIVNTSLKIPPTPVAAP